MVILTLCFAAMGCEKEEVGEKGQAGQNGVVGSSGDDYSYYKKEFLVDSLDWYPVDGIDFEYFLTDSTLTTEVIDSSLILVYLMKDGAKYALPYWFWSNDLYFEFRYAIMQGGVKLFIRYQDYPNRPPDMKFELAIGR